MMKLKQTFRMVPLLFVAIIFGSFIRLYAVWKAGFPLVDGGMFYTMITDLENAHFVLPIFTSYNHLQIPYAYPPLGFYIAGALNIFFHIPLLDLLRWLPSIFSILTIPCFYYLGKAMLGSDTRASLAALLFALMPLGYIQQLWGGGLTRSLGAIFAILFANFAYRVFSKQNPKLIPGAILTGAAVVLSHPEWAAWSAASGLLFWLFFGRNRRGLFNAIFLGAGVVILTMPWWGWVSIHHGAKIFWLASTVSEGRLLFWVPLLKLNFGVFSDSLVVTLAIIGAFLCIKNKNAFLPIWLVVCMFVDPRGVSHSIPIQTTILGTIALSDVIFPSLIRIQHKTADKILHPDDNLIQTISLATLGYITIVMLVNAFTTASNMAEYNVLPGEDIHAMDWIHQETALESRFIVVGWNDSLWVSPLTEWFPALSQRTSLSTLQGREWLSGNQNALPWMDNFISVQACLYKDINCLQEWSDSQREPFNYVYISSRDPNSEGDPVQISPLLISLEQDQGFVSVYRTESVVIFKKL